MVPDRERGKENRERRNNGSYERSGRSKGDKIRKKIAKGRNEGNKS